MGGSRAVISSCASQDAALDSGERIEEKGGAVTESEMAALLDAHDALIRACVESHLAFEEFVAAYGDFPAALDEGAGRAVLRLFGKRIAFHKLVAGAISGLRGEGGSPGMETEVGRFMPMVGLMRLRELVARYPEFKAHGCPVRSVTVSKALHEA
jgi:hypothetical protein